MRNPFKRSTWSVILAVVGVAAIAAAIATTASAKAKGKTAAATTVTLLSGTGPQSLDPGLDYTTQGAEINWEVYTGLTTYKHANGTASTQLQPGLATALPVISHGGKTYTVTLRKGLKYSNGDTVQASDFLYTVERSLTIPWGGASTFVTPYVVGAAAYASHKAKTISGISANNTTGKIVIHLTQPYGPFANVLAFPAFGLVDPKTAPEPFKVQASDPPAGAGPYMVTDINIGKSFNIVPNPNWTATPGIPKATVSFQEQIDSNVNANALSVLKNSNEVFDWADTIPPADLSAAKASGHDKLVDLGGSVYYFFLNASKPPFNNQLAREAVVAGLNENGFSRLGSGTLAPGCYFLPPGIPGHGTGSCPYGNPATGNVSKAKKLLKESGQANVPIVVYGEERSPRLQWEQAYVQELQQIGFTNVKLKEVADENYFTVIGESKKVDPQTGFADWNEDFPNPVDFYGVLLNGKAIQPTDNENFGQTNDPYVNKQIAKLGVTPTTQISKVVAGWQSLEKYVAKKAYAAVFGYQSFPFFTSKNITVKYTNDIYGWDLLAIQPK
ncbi:MAG TPA: ABC transporter substrate-binding protein [Solirubrobacteraceae bacterium]|nr:ABC transporter substrate-binding protein [Solirubrobacteraceae bacterium]